MKLCKYAVLLIASNAVTASAKNIEYEDIETLRTEIGKINEKLNTYNEKLAHSELILKNYNLDSMQSTEVKDKESKKTFSERVKFYGFIRADVGYQLDGEKGMANFTNTLRLDGEPPKSTIVSNRFEATIAASRIGMDIDIPLQGNELKGKIEIDFGAGAYKEAIRLRHAYVKNNNWLIGQTTSNFVSFATTPEMLDPNTPLGGATYRPMMLRYENKINEKTPYAIALEKGHDQNRLPALTAKISHQVSNTLLVNLRGLLQEVHVPELNDQTKIGTGIAVGINYKPLEKLILNTNVANVSGDNRFLLGTYDNKRYLQNEPELKLVEYNSFTLGATYKFNSNLRSTIGYGNLTYNKNNENGNKELEQTWINLGYTPWKAVTLGMEYVTEKRTTIDGQKGTHDRVGMVAQYNF